VYNTVMTSIEGPIAIRHQEWPEDMEPMVSIGCLAYNHDGFIGEAIESFLNQKTTFKVEILIHDDASVDGTAVIIKEYAEEWPQLFSVILQTENQYSRGVQPGALNLQRAKGKYIALCEGDDYWTDPLKLQKQVEFLESHPDYSVCVGGYTSYLETESSTGGIHISSIEDDSAEGFTFTLEEMTQTWLTKLLTALVRRDVLESFNPTVYKHYRDIHFFYHLIRHHKAYYFKESFGVHRVHPGGVNSMKQGVVNHRAAYNCYRELYEQNRDEFTRYMCLKSTLGFFNYNLFHRYEGNGLLKKLRLYGEAVLLVRNLSEAKWLFTAFIKASLKGRIKEIIG
jgi:glycosyltransferase involved in cell wall biosynthesis